MNAAAIDALTILRSTSGKYATKQFSRQKDGTIKNRSFGDEKYFSVTSVPVADINSLAHELSKIARNPRCFVIRGEPLPATNRARTRRLSEPDPKTGEPAAFEDQPRRWLSVDVDKIPCPALTDPVTDPEGAVEYVIGLMPPELHDATCWWQFSSSQSVRVTPDTPETISLHLWYWLDEPLDSAALKRWAIAANQIVGYKLIGPEFFRTVQAHYVAAPLFAEPLKDPLARRCGLRKGLDEAVSLIIPVAAPKRPYEPSKTGYEPGIGVAAHLREIGGPKGNRSPIMATIASYIAIHGSTADVQPVYQAIRSTLDRAVPGWRTDPDGQPYLDDEHLDKIAHWVRQHHGDQPPKGFHPDPPPHIVDPEIPLPEAELPEARPPEFSDDALALRFSNAHSDSLRHVALWGRWLQWNGTYWDTEETLRTFDLARAICRAASTQVLPDQAKLAAAIASAKTVAAVERLAKADRRHAATADQWDADPAIIHGEIVTINLTTGECHQPRREDYITKSAAVKPDPDCPAPLWNAFLDRVTAGDKDLQAYLQRVAGYCLTGYTREHALFFLYGKGANGKGVFLNTLTAIWCGYAAVAAMETFIETQNDQHPADLAMLRGARLVVAQEVDKGRAWNQGKINRMTGGDPISARFMRQDFFTYKPQFKLVIAGNNKPSLRSVDEAVRRRFNLIPFTVTIPPAEHISTSSTSSKPNGPASCNGPSTGAWLGRSRASARPEPCSPPPRNTSPKKTA
jgi:P4 family phage/plasmid primase-like protien